MPQKTQTFQTRQHMTSHTYELFRYRDHYLNEVALHHHDFYEVYFFLSGDVEYIVESRKYRLTSGDILLISPNELHQPMFGKDRQPYERIVLWIDKSYLNEFSNIGPELNLCFETARKNQTNLLRPDGASRESFALILERMLSEQETEEYAGSLFSECCLVQALILLNRVARHSTARPELPDKSSTLVANVLTYINEHYAEDLTLDYLANRFFISKYHLSREFGRLVGTSVHRYLIQKRLAMAKQLLGEGIPSSEVYQYCGFGDYSNFYRAFKSEYKISPKEYINQLKADTARNVERARGRSWLLNKEE